MNFNLLDIYYRYKDFLGYRNFGFSLASIAYGRFCVIRSLFSVGIVDGHLMIDILYIHVCRKRIKKD